MKDETYVLSGMMYGDEGKGTFVDYVASKHNIKQNIRFNGGSQASHTVVTNDGQVHKFSQLGSGMFQEGCRTYLSDNMVVNPLNLIEEIKQFADKLKINPDNLMKRVFINKDCYVVTPYHRLINKLKELSSAYIRRGSFGTGVSEVRKVLNETGLGLQMKDLTDKHNQDVLRTKLEALFYYTRELLMINRPFIKDNDYENLIDEAEVYYLTDLSRKNKVLECYEDLVANVNFNVISDFADFYHEDEKAVFEGSQGLLIDSNYGFRPNVASLDTTNLYAMKLLKDHEHVNKIGLAKSFATRHGLGVFPTEDASLNTLGEEQETTYWIGNVRFGWFDAVLMRYAQAINKVDEVYLSMMDKISVLPSIKICNSYQYTGILDEGFKNTFDYEIINHQIIVKDVKPNQNDKTTYLYQCKPIYIEVDGWDRDISNIKDVDNLPKNCLDYIALIEKLTGVNITLLSTGPSRKDKVKVR